MSRLSLICGTQNNIDLKSSFTPLHVFTKMDNRMVSIAEIRLSDDKILSFTSFKRRQLYLQDNERECLF